MRTALDPPNLAASELGAPRLVAATANWAVSQFANRSAALGTNETSLVEEIR